MVILTSTKTKYSVKNDRVSLGCRKGLEEGIGLLFIKNNNKKPPTTLKLMLPAVAICALNLASPLLSAVCFV